jgi:hypothetical protein
MNARYRRGCSAANEYTFRSLWSAFSPASSGHPGSNTPLATQAYEGGTLILIVAVA